MARPMPGRLAFAYVTAAREADGHQEITRPRAMGRAVASCDLPVGRHRRLGIILVLAAGGYRAANCHSALATVLPRCVPAALVDNLD